jgi:hypothetical protein
MKVQKKVSDNFLIAGRRNFTFGRLRRIINEIKALKQGNLKSFTLSEHTNLNLALSSMSDIEKEWELNYMLIRKENNMKTQNK